jgi:O-antigen ligase
VVTTGTVLAGLLAFAVLTLWVSERWVLSCVEAGAYLFACAIVILRAGRIRVSIALLAPVFMCAWAAIQWGAHWSAVPSATVDSGLYWLAAACFVLIGSQAESVIFLKTSLVLGAMVCVAGTIQMFTSPGNVFWLFPSGFDRRVIGPFVSPNNYAAFVELLLPLALVRRGWPYLTVAAVLTATVVASASRTGAALVLAEIAVVMLLHQWNRRPILAFVFLAGILTVIVGAQFLTSRLLQKNDLFAVRREFLHSSLAMFHSEPLHGFGLGTWPFVYPRFAVIDTGEMANHAHNEWVQWAAEGGVPAFAVMLGLMISTIRPAILSVWGIGLLAVFAHALVDYPFLRLGLAAWIFAFLGVLSASARHCKSLPVAGIIPVLLFGTFEAGKLAYADVLYRRATLSSVQKAVTLTPDRAEYHFVLAELDPSHAIEHLQRALSANAYDTRSDIGLALEHEAAGDPAAAEQSLLHSAGYDHQFAPAWALAGFYFRQGNLDEFWRWAQNAAAMSYGDRRAYFDLCFLVCENSHEVFAKLVNAYPALEAPFLDYLLVRHRIHEATEVAQKMTEEAAPSDRDALFDYIDAAIDAGEVAAAWQVQGRLWGTQTLMVNGDFARPLSGRGFDWRIEPTKGVSMARTEDGGSALSVEFSGREPESCGLLDHALALDDEVNYVLRFDYRSVGLPAQTGISWRLESAGVFAFEASMNWTHEVWRIRGTTRKLKLAYQCIAGNARAEGRFFLRNVQIDVAPL